MAYRAGMFCLGPDRQMRTKGKGSRPIEEVDDVRDAIAVRILGKTQRSVHVPGHHEWPSTHLALGELGRECPRFLIGRRDRLHRKTAQLLNPGIDGLLNAL